MQRHLHVGSRRAAQEEPRHDRANSHRSTAFTGTRVEPSRRDAYSVRMRFVFLFFVACGGHADDPIDAGKDATIDSQAMSLAECDAASAGMIPFGQPGEGWACDTCETDLPNEFPTCTNRMLTCKQGSPVFCPCGYAFNGGPCCDPCDAGTTPIICDEKLHRWRCPTGTFGCGTEHACGDAGAD